MTEMEMDMELDTGMCDVCMYVCRYGLMNM